MRAAKRIDIVEYRVYIVYTRREAAMVKKMIQHGNSSALVIDKPIMELLNITPDTPLELATDGKNLIISPVREEGRMEKLNRSLEKINKRHRRTLEKLAK
jgi:antitoxin component of MazEF toxin-antitoxin module